MLFSENALKAAIWKSFGNYSEAARILSKKTGKEISRSAVWSRCKALPGWEEELAQIKEAEKDYYEKVIRDIAKPEEEEISPKTRLDAAKFWLNNKAKDRGYNSDIGIEAGDFKVNININTDVKSEGDPDLEENEG